MSNPKLKIANTELDNLIGNLRGEVGEIITDWVIMRQFMGRSRQLASPDPAKDMTNPEYTFVNLLVDKLRDELIGRLSEIAEKKVGRLTFYFAAQKLKAFEAEADAFEKYIIKHEIRRMRNRDVSHKELPEKWSDHYSLRIPYKVQVRAVAMALRLMKRIDRKVLGPSSPYCWREARKRRYTHMSPPRAGYMLVPYMALSGDARVKILQEELREGANAWEEIETTINGQATKVLACKKWGIVMIGTHMLVLPHYPLQQLSNIQFEPKPQSEPSPV